VQIGKQAAIACSLQREYGTPTTILGRILTVPCYERVAALTFETFITGKSCYLPHDTAGMKCSRRAPYALTVQCVHPCRSLNLPRVSVVIVARMSDD
jgi:hypothetical protein